MFVPNYARQRITCLFAVFAATQLVSYKETLEWIGSSIMIVSFHGGQVVEFGYRVSGRFRDPLLRQLDEAVRIEEESGLLLNSKNEWVRPAGVQHRVERM